MEKVCKYCQESYSNPYVLKDHINIVHTEGAELVCKYCKKRFRSKTGFVQHTKYNCKNRPKDEVVEGELKYVCHDKECGKKFPTKSALTLHAGKHAVIPPYPCNLCDRRFTQKNDVNRHQVTHTKEKNFTCDVCFKSFTESGSVKKHKKELHPPPPPPPPSN